MEQHPPGGDHVSGDGDPSTFHNPPASWTPNPAGEQAQGESVSRGDDVSQAASHPPELKRRKVFSAVSASHVLKKHEEEFFDVVNPTLNLLLLKRKEVISEGLIPKIETADNTSDAKEILFDHLNRYADVASLREYCEMARAAHGFPKMQNLGEKMLKELALEGVSRGDDVSQAASHSPQLKRRKFSSTISGVSRGDDVSQAVSHSPELKRKKDSSTTSDHPDHLILFRKYVSRKAAGKGRAVLEGVGLDSETIAACFNSHPLNEEEAVQAGLAKWCGGRGKKSPTWQVLFAAMEYAQIAKQHVNDLKKESGLFGTQCVTEPITEAVTGGHDKSPKDKCRSSTEEATVARYKVEEEAKNGSKGEPSDVPGLVTGGPTATTTGSQLQTQSSVPDQVTGGPTATTRGSQPQTQVVAVSPVILAAKIGQLSTVRILLKGRAATVEDRDKEGLTALLWATLNGHLPVVRELVNVYKVDLFQKYKDGQNAMHCAAVGGHIKIIKFLLPLFGERVHEKDNHSSTMLHFAATGGHCQVARYLIEEVEMDPQDRDKMGNTALLRAAMVGRVPLMRMLLEDYGSTLDEATEEGMNAMHLAAQGGHIEVIKFLLPLFGERVYEKTNSSSTILHMAAQKGHCQVARYLIEEMHLDPQDRDKMGNTALLLAAFNGSVPLVRMLLEDCGSTLDEVNEEGMNAMHLAALGEHIEVIKFLLPLFEERVNEKTNKSYTMLHMAAKMGQSQVVRYLIEELQMDPHDTDEEGMNAMHLAAEGGHIEVIKFLLPLFGERVHEKTDDSCTVLHLAASGGHCQVARYLIEEVQMDPQDRDERGHTALLRAAGADVDSVPLVRMLLEDYGSSVDDLNEDGCNALHIAAFCGHLELVKYLIPLLGEKKFAVTLRGGHTCLTLAIQRQKEDVVEYLIQEGGFGRQH